MVAKSSSSSSTTSAASRAASVPDRPMATPIVASLSAGVVDAVAGHGHDLAALAQGPGEAQLVLR
jgi:hypothetical protein